MTALARRQLLGAAVGLAALSACAQDERGPGPGATRGARQPGVTHPDQQRFGKVTVLDRQGSAHPELLGRLLAEVDLLSSGAVSAVPEPGDLTVTVGLAEPGLVLPRFARDDIDARRSGGDVVLQVCASDPATVLAASDHLCSVTGLLQERWSQLGFAGERNLLGFHDGTVQPRGEAERTAGVWTEDDTTVMVVRRIELDVDGFADLPLARQEAVIGRRKLTGAPLSGGRIGTPLDLGAKTPAGAYLIPSGAHVRRAHPLATGRPLMQRRGYSFAEAGVRGLLFISFQRDLAAFVQTQFRLDAGDDLNAFTRVTASGVFRVPARVRP